MYSQNVSQLDWSTQSTNMLLAFYISIHLYTHMYCTSAHTGYFKSFLTDSIDFKEALKST